MNKKINLNVVNCCPGNILAFKYNYLILILFLHCYVKLFIGLQGIIRILLMNFQSFYLSQFLLVIIVLYLVTLIYMCADMYMCYMCTSSTLFEDYQRLQPPVPQNALSVALRATFPQHPIPH